jgi:hypothetical protein
MDKRIYKLVLDGGLFEEIITAVFKSFFSCPIPELDFAGVHHFEFYGPRISNTGYLSHFIFVGEIEEDKIEEYIKDYVEFKTKLKIKSITEEKPQFF